MSFIVATNVLASQPPKHRQTGMPHALANLILIFRVFFLEIESMNLVFLVYSVLEEILDICVSRAL